MHSPPLSCSTVYMCQCYEREHFAHAKCPARSIGTLAYSGFTPLNCYKISKKGGKTLCPSKKMT